MRDVDSLKEILAPHDDVVFIDNSKILEKALEPGHLYEYFIDMFAGDFGHCTSNGNRLIAENIAETILPYLLDIPSKQKAISPSPTKTTKSDNNNAN